MSLIVPPMKVVFESSTFDDAALWPPQGGGVISVTADAAVAPDGTTTADKLVALSVSSNVHRIAATLSLVVGSAYKAVVYVKADGYNVLVFSLDTPATTLIVDLSNGTLGGGVGTVEAATNGYYKITFTFVATTTSSPMRLWVFDTVAHALALTAFTGDDASGVLVWGAQVSVDISNPRRVSRRVGGSLKLPLVNFSKAYTASNVAFAPGTGSFSAFAWVRFDGRSFETAVTHQVFGFHDTNYAAGWMLSQNGSNLFVYVGSAGPVLTHVGFFTTRRNARWNRIGVVANATDGRVRAYWNGVLAGYSGGGASWNITANEKVYVGASTEFGTMIGTDVADFCYHVGVALSDEQARQDYEGVVSPTNLTGRWKFDEVYGSTTAVDSSGGGRNMSLGGSAALCGEAVM